MIFDQTFKELAGDKGVGMPGQQCRIEIFGLSKDVEEKFLAVALSVASKATCRQARITAAQKGRHKRAYYESTQRSSPVKPNKIRSTLRREGLAPHLPIVVHERTIPQSLRRSAFAHANRRFEMRMSQGRR